MTLTPHTEEWLTRADEDLRAAVLMSEEGSLPNPICFHAQQVAEKALKGYLVAHGQIVRKTHALDDLLARCTKRNPMFEQLRDDALYLTQFYTEARYPGDFSAFTLEQAKRAVGAARHVLDFVRACLRDDDGA